MVKDFSKKNLQKKSFKGEDLSYARFIESDLRGTDFTDCNLTGANFTHVKTGITPLNTILIFIAALAASLLSGYIAMLAGHTVQQMLSSTESNIRNAGIITIVITVVFILFLYWKGGRNAIIFLVIPVITVATVIAIISYTSGFGTGMGMVYQILALFLIVIMFIVGTIARAAAGSLSNILFIIVALSGGMFGKSLGGGIGTVIMAVSCALISKKALSGAKDFKVLRQIACFITRKFGTSFRNARLENANFSWAKINNCDFTDADIFQVVWGNTKKNNCIIHDDTIMETNKTTAKI